MQGTESWMCFLRQELRMPHEMNCATMRGARHPRIRARPSAGCGRESVPSDESLSRMSFGAAKFPRPTRSCLQRARSCCSKAAPPQLLSSSGSTFESSDLVGTASKVCGRSKHGKTGGGGFLRDRRAGSRSSRYERSPGPSPAEHAEPCRDRSGSAAGQEAPRPLQSVARGRA